MECSTTDCLQVFTEKRQNLAFGWILVIKPKHFRDFYEILIWEFFNSFNTVSPFKVKLFRKFEILKHLLRH